MFKRKPTTQSQLTAKKPRRRRSTRLGKLACGKTWNGKTTNQTTLDILKKEKIKIDTANTKRMPSTFTHLFPPMVLQHVLLPMFGLPDLSGARAVSTCFERFWKQSDALPLLVPHDFPSVRQAIKYGKKLHKKTSLTILLSEGNFDEGGEEISITYSVSILGASSSTTTIQGSFRIHNHQHDDDAEHLKNHPEIIVSFSDLMLKGDLGANYCGVSASQGTSFTLNNLDIQQFHYGVIVDGENTHGTMHNCLVSGNRASGVQCQNKGNLLCSGKKCLFSGNNTCGYGHGMYVGENSWIDVVLPLTKETLSCGNRMEQNCAGFGNVYCVSQFVDVDNSGSKMESTCERKSVVWN